MNVVIINDHADIRGGADRVAIDSAVAATEFCSNVYFFAGGGETSDSLRKNNVKVVNLKQEDVVERANKINGAISGLWNVKAARDLLQLLERLPKEDTILHVHSWTHVLSASIFDSVSKLRFKVLITAHDYFLACPNGAFYNYVQGCSCGCSEDMTTCPSISCDKRSSMQKKYRLLRQRITMKALSSVNLSVAFVSLFQSNILKNHLDDDIKTFVLENPINIVNEGYSGCDSANQDSLLFVGRVDKEKGAELFCKVAKKLGRKAIVVGDGPLKEEMEKDYPEIVFAGWRQLEEMARYVGSSSVFVFSSLLFECSPLVVREIQYNFGLPCVVPCQCAARDFVTDGVNGCYFLAGDEDSLANAITKICKPENLAVVSENSRSLVGCYDVHKYSRDLERIYVELLNE